MKRVRCTQPNYGRFTFRKRRDLALRTLPMPAGDLPVTHYPSKAAEPCPIQRATGSPGTKTVMAWVRVEGRRKQWQFELNSPAHILVMRGEFRGHVERLRRVGWSMGSAMGVAGV